jgi:hypothetical protein
MSSWFCPIKILKERHGSIFDTNQLTSFIPNNSCLSSLITENSNTLRESYFTLQKKLIKIYIGIWVMTVLTRNDPNLYIYYNSIDTDLRHFVRWLLPFPLICSLAEKKNMWLTKVYSERGCSRGHDHMLVGFICYRYKITEIRTFLQRESQNS